MSHKGKSRSVKTTHQNYINLMYSDSDSDTIPDLKLPPLRSKKQKRRNILSERQDSRLCGLWTVLKLVTGITVLVALVFLAGVCFWSVQQITALQEKIQVLQTSEKSSPEIVNIQSQITEMSKSVSTGQSSLQNITNTIADIQNKMKDLQESNKALQSSVSASKDLLNQPENMKSVSMSLVQLRSDVIRIEHEQASKHEQLESRLAALEHQASVKEQDMGSSSSVDSTAMTSWNQSFIEELQNLSQKLEARIIVLEEYNKAHGPQLDSVGITELVSRLLEEKMAKLTTDSHGSWSFPENNLTLPAVSVFGEFLAFRADMLANFEETNETIMQLNEELETLSARLDSHDRALINITTVITSTLHNGPVQNLFPPTTTASSSKSLNPAAGHDLHQAFNKTWPTDIESLNAILSASVNKTQFKKFDSNGDDLYNEEEMAAALDLQPDPRR